MNKPIQFPVRGFLNDKRDQPSSEPQRDRLLMEKWGVVFGKKLDNWWQEATLPAGWKVTGSGYWHHLFDNFGRQRASYFFKSACYDYDVFGSCDRRFNVEARPIHGVWEDDDAVSVAVVTDGGRPIWVEKINVADAKKREYSVVRKIAEDKLKELNLSCNSIEDEWDKPYIDFVVEGAQVKRYRLKRFHEIKEKVKDAQEKLKQLSNVVYYDVASDDGENERFICMHDMMRMNGTYMNARALSEKERKNASERKAKHEHEQQTAESKLNRLQNILYSLQTAIKNQDG